MEAHSGRGTIASRSLPLALCLTPPLASLPLPRANLRRKLDKKPVDETLRAAIKSYCTGMVTAINRSVARAACALSPP